MHIANTSSQKFFERFKGKTSLLNKEGISGAIGVELTNTLIS